MRIDNRYNYGVCVNTDKDGTGQPCAKCKSKEIQKVDKLLDFECQECHEQLQHVNPPKSTLQKLLPFLLLFSAIIIVGIIWLIKPNQILSNNEIVKADSSHITQSIDSAIVESIGSISKTTATEADKISKSGSKPTQTDSKSVNSSNAPENKASSEKSPTPAYASPQSTKTRGTLNLSYGTYSGDVKDGYPNGQGRLTYSVSRQINRYDSKHRTANAGDYIIGEFKNGFFVHGKHFGTDGELIESLMIGVPANNSFESK